MTDGSARIHRTSGTDLRWMRAVTAASLAALVLMGCFLQFVLGVTSEPGPRAVLLTGTTIAATCLALAVIPLLLQPSSRALARHPLLLALLATACLTWALALIPPFAGWGSGFLLAIAGGMLGCVVAGWWRAVALVGTLGVLALGSATGLVESSTSSPGGPAIGDPSTLVIVSTLALLSIIPLSTVWVLRVVLRLDQARRTASELAVATERLRFATDLHDIQGHHLQVIALKGELAERRLASGEASLAAAELADIRSIAQAALEDTRAVVNDYRTVTVAVEARNAAAVLRSAGIDCTARIDTADLPTDLGAVFAVAIREAVTNIMRHSAATTATVELGRPAPDEYRLTITNDRPGAVRTGGTGIVGLRERVAARGGTVSTRRDDDAFTLVVSIPATSPDAGEGER
ncbi:sensor histidine kinase [Leifsonia shinshuensis]